MLSTDYSFQNVAWSVETNVFDRHVHVVSLSVYLYSLPGNLDESWHLCVTLWYPFFLFLHLFAPNHDTLYWFYSLFTGQLQFMYTLCTQISLLFFFPFILFFFLDKEVTSTWCPVGLVQPSHTPSGSRGLCSVWSEAADLLPDGGLSCMCRTASAGRHKAG